MEISKSIVVLLMVAAVMLLGLSCESNLIEGDESYLSIPGEGIWLCLGEPDDGENKVKKIAFDGTDMVRTPPSSWAVAMSIDATSGDIWISEKGTNDKYRIVKRSDTGAELGRITQDDTDYAWQAVDLSADENDGSCWFVSPRMPGEMGHVVRLDANCNIVADCNDIADPRGVSSYHTDGSCWVRDETMKSVAKLDAEGELLFLRHESNLIPYSIAVDQRNGSCWVGYGKYLVKYNSAGARIVSVSLEYDILEIVVNGDDGSICIQSGSDMVERYSYRAEYMWRFYVSKGLCGFDFARDGSVWAANSDNAELFHISETGTQISYLPLDMPPTAIGVRD